MPLEIHRAIIDRLPDPVLILDEQGEVTGFNPAARCLIEAAPDLMNTLTPFIQAAMPQMGIQPLRLNPGAPLVLDRHHYAPWLMPTREEIALILLPNDDGQGIRHQPIGTPQDVAFSTLLNAKLRQELRRVADQVSLFDSGSTDLGKELRRMQQLLSTIDVMCSMLQHPQSVHGERLTLHELVLQALARRGLASSCLTQSGVSRARTPGTRHFYGHARWLLWTLDTLLALMPVTAESSDHQLALHLRHGDSFVVLSGELRAPAQAHLNWAKHAARFVSADVVDAMQRSELDADMQLALATQVIEFHGGDLLFEKDGSEGAYLLCGFQLSMPLGRVPSSALTSAPGQWVPLSQAAALARDLAQLLPRRVSGRGPLSQEEHDMLAHLYDPTQNQ